jgi:hypothetical protein
MNHGARRFPGKIEKQFLVHFQIRDLQGMCQPLAPLRQDACFIVIDSHDSLLEEAMRVRSPDNTSPDNTRLSHRSHRPARLDPHLVSAALVKQPSRAISLRSYPEHGVIICRLFHPPGQDVLPEAPDLHRMAHQPMPIAA